MTKRFASSAAPGEIADVLIEMMAASGAMNEWMLANLDARAWRAKLPGAKSSEGRSLAAIFAHLHNCRLNWIRRSAPHMKCPAALNPDRCTMKQAAAAHRRSAASCVAMLKDVLKGGDARRIRRFSRGSWTREWPAGPSMFLYMFAHDAHHRGQILMLAHQLGYRLPQYPGIWQWDKLWKECGFETRPR